MGQAYRAERVETRFCVVLTVQPLFCFLCGGKVQGKTNKEKIITFYLAPACGQTLFIILSSIFLSPIRLNAFTLFESSKQNKECDKGYKAVYD